MIKGIGVLGGPMVKIRDLIKNAILNIFRYERVWDEADYVIPPAENGAFFVTTNVVITPNQTWGTCPEVNKLLLDFFCYHMSLILLIDL